MGTPPEAVVMALAHNHVSSIVNEVIRAIKSLLFFYKEILHAKNTNKKHTRRYVLIIFKKKLFIYL